MESDQRELALRAHIRNLLLNYSLTHLSTNYVTWTQDTVRELLSEGLSYVSTTDPKDPLLPSDPYERLLRLWRVDKLTPYNESWTSEGETKQLIKKQLTAVSERPTRECWRSNEDVDYEKWLGERPMSPVLAISSMRQTPKLGSLPATRTIPRTQQEVLELNNVRRVFHEELPIERPPQLQVTLDLKLKVDTRTHNATIELFKSVPTLQKGTAPPDIHAKAKNFLRADSPPLEFVELASPPIFSRYSHPGYNSAGTSKTISQHGLPDIQKLSEVISSVTIKKEDEEQELYKQHMVVVDGWQAYAMVSSPLTAGTPSLGGSSSEVDELFLPSPPGHGRPFIEELMDAKLDEHEIPRSQKIGSTQENSQFLGQGLSLAAFLSPLRHRRRSVQDEPKVVTTPKSQPSSPHTAITASMLGQPPTSLAYPTGLLGTMELPSDDGSDPDTHVMLKRIYGVISATEDVAQAILYEKLDENDSLLMDVPVMPPPNEHAPTPTFLPSNTVELLASTKPKGPVDEQSGDPESSRHGHLRKVKGLQALTIELSWIPFKFGASVPTDVEVSEVADNILNVLTRDLRSHDPDLEPELSQLLDETLHAQERGAEAEEVWPSVRECLEDAWEQAAISRAEVSGVELVLTRAERKVLRGHDQDEDLESSDKENEGLEHLAYEDEADIRPPKRTRITNRDGNLVDDAEDHNILANDFGVLLSSSAVTTGNAGRFRDLACAAEGFEGPDADGDLFLDIDPIHEMDYGVSPPPGYLQRATRARSRQQDERVRRAPDARPQHREDTDPVDEARVAASNTNIDGLSSNLPLNDKTSVATADSIHLPAFSGTGGPSFCSNFDSRLPDKTASCAQHLLAEFLFLVGKKSDDAVPNAAFPAQEKSPVQLKESPSLSGVTVPAELNHPQTLCLPEPRLHPTGVHRYLLCVELLQKQVLVRCLSTPQCAIDLVEREDLGDAHLIMDPDTAVLYFSLSALPSSVDTMLTALSRLSWRYVHVLLIFEAYPVSLSYKRDDGSPRPSPYPFSPAVIKAVKKLRRDLDIAEACQTKSPSSAIYFAFATSVKDAASYARYFGELAESRDASESAIWGRREWLDVEEQDGERDLAGVDGMNAFAASVILSQISLDDFLALTPEERVRYFGPYAGHGRLIRLNEDLLRRAQAVEMPSSSPISYNSVAA